MLIIILPVGYMKVIITYSIYNKQGHSRGYNEDGFGEGYNGDIPFITEISSLSVTEITPLWPFPWS